MKRFWHRTLGTTTLLLALIFPGLQVQAQPSTYQLVDRDQAAMNGVRVQVAPGRATPISFSHVDETITYLLLGDPSRLVYSTDAALETQQAKTVFLRVIQPLDFPGATTTPVTNLIVQTVDAQGQERLYTFDLIHSSHPRALGVQIVPARPMAAPPEAFNITAEEIQMGLRQALLRGYTSADDPVVAKVHQLLEIGQAGDRLLLEAAQSVELPWAVLVELGRLAQEGDTGSSWQY